MDDAFDVLEDKVRRATELVRRLRHEKRELEEQAAQARARLGQTEKKLQALEQARGAEAEQGQALEGLRREVDTLRLEREEVRTRIARIVELLEGLD